MIYDGPAKTWYVISGCGLNFNARVVKNVRRPWIYYGKCIPRMSGGVFPPDTEGMIKKGAHTGTEGPSALKVTARRSDFKPRTRRRVVPGEMAGFYA